MQYESVSPDGILGPFTGLAPYTTIRYISDTGHWLTVDRIPDYPDLVLVQQNDLPPRTWLDASAHFTWDPVRYAITLALGNDTFPRRDGADHEPTAELATAIAPGDTVLELANINYGPIRAYDMLEIVDPYPGTRTAFDYTTQQLAMVVAMDGGVCTVRDTDLRAHPADARVRVVSRAEIA